MSFNKRIKPMITDEEPTIPEDTPPIPDKKYPVEGMTTGPIWLRSEPNENAHRIIVITSGRVIDIYENLGEWSKIGYDGEIGYGKSAWIKEV